MAISEKRGILPSKLERECAATVHRFAASLLSPRPERFLDVGVLPTRSILMALRLKSSVALLGVLLVNVASAHHNMTAMFDLNDKVTLTGTFTKVDWRNPHINLTMDVKDTSGKVETWQIEGRRRTS